MKSLLIGLALLVAYASPTTAQDAEGCTDHPLFPKRITGYIITECQVKEFDEARMTVPAGPNGARDRKLEGKVYTYTFAPAEGATSASEVQVRRNYQNAAKAAGGEVVFDGGGRDIEHAEQGPLYKLQSTTLRFIKDGKEVWANIGFTGAFFPNVGFILTIVEVGEMAQDVVASSELLNLLNSQGRVALEVNFDTGSDKIKAESQPVLDEVRNLLSQNGDLRLNIEGHTDNVGDAAANLALSKKRAAAVVAWLTSQGIAAGRLSSAGFGATRPVADNASELGRARNRRVELVKQ